MQFKSIFAGYEGLGEREEHLNRAWVRAILQMDGTCGFASW